MAESQDIFIIRAKAKRYSALTADYSAWTSRIKQAVRNAQDEDWGTFIAACALLEDVVPRDEQDRIARRVELDRLTAEYQERMEKQTHATRNASAAIAAVLACVTDIVLVILGNQYSFSFAEYTPLLSAFGLFLFSIVGASSAGFALGSMGERKKGFGRFAMPVSALAGLACALVCPVFPPLALVLAWAAWHSSGIGEPRPTKLFQSQAANRIAHGQRTYANDHRAPQFVKNAIRLAGIYQTRVDYAGDVARAALSQRQTDYGAFVAYEAILSEYHEACRQEELNEEDQSEDDYDDEEENDSTNDEASEEENQSRRSEILVGGIASALAAVVLLLCATNIESIVHWPPSAIHEQLIVAVIAALGLISIIIGRKSAIRIASIYGLSIREQHLASVCRSAWFASWFMLIGLYMLHIAAQL